MKMLRLARLPLSRKLTLVIMATSSVALLLTSAVFLVYDLVSFRRGMVQAVTILANVIGANSTAALTFNDPRSAEATLSALAAERHVVGAAIYSRSGEVFARYARRGASPQLPARRPEGAGHRFEADALEVYRPILLDREAIGSVLIRSDLEQVDVRVRRYATAVLAAVLGSSLVALVLSSRLQRIVSDPILRLAETARRVTEHEDYTVRAEKAGQDELGALVDDFNDMLERIRERDLALQRRSAELEAANRELAAFSYSVSHDLRAPLHTIDGFSQVLLEDYEQVLDQEGKDYLTRLRRATQRMGQLIEDMLTLSRVSRGELRRERVELSELARGVALELAPRSPGREVVLTIADGLVAEGDPRLLRVVLENLLANAWKFTSRRPVAHVEFGARPHGEGGTAFFVRDDGAGFQMAYADKLFGAFQRLHAPEEFEGTGIGLATVQRIVHRHGGQVWAEGELDRGATFYFTL